MQGNPQQLAAERDRIAAELSGVKVLLGKIREAAFDQDAKGAYAAIRTLLVENWDAATPQGKTFDLVRHVDHSKVSGTGGGGGGLRVQERQGCVVLAGSFQQRQRVR